MAIKRTAKKTSPEARVANKAAGTRLVRDGGSRILEAMHETASDFHHAGLIDMATMRKFNALCLPEIPNYSAEQIKRLRRRCHISQAVFAKYMNVSKSSLQKWEIGEKRPSNIALKLLNVVDRKGLEALT